EMTVHRITPRGTENVVVTLSQLEKEAQPLEALSAGCASCPANVLGSELGCFGYLNYPISAETERELSQRVATPQPLIDAGFDGEPARRMRASGRIFEAAAPVTASADAVFHAFLSVGGQLEPDE